MRICNRCAAFGEIVPATFEARIWSLAYEVQTLVGDVCGVCVQAAADFLAGKKSDELAADLPPKGKL